MPKTKFQSLIFTLITAFIMVYFMTVYNIVLSGAEFTNAIFAAAIKEMWAEYIIIFLLAYFVSSKLAVMCAFRVVKPTDRQIFIIFSIQIFTVIFQVMFASVLGVYKSGGFNENFVPNYLQAYVFNFALALPLQFIVAGPAARGIFRKIFCAN